MDKASIAGLAATLGHYARGEAIEQIPVWRMIAAPLDELRCRASGWADACGDAAAAEVIAGRSMIGGGSLPEEGLETALCAIGAPPGGADALTAALRSASPPIVARIEHDRVLLDPRTVEAADDAHVEATLHEATAPTRDAPDGAAGHSAGR
jgi:L-seryl-tRNA(Ser) seleniumtransferase